METSLKASVCYLASPVSLVRRAAFCMLDTAAAWGPVMMLRMLFMSFALVFVPISAHGQTDLDLTEALRHSCEAGNALGCGALGDMYRAGQGVRQDYARAAELYRQACEGGNLDGCYNLAIMYANGGGVRQDYTRAAELYRQSCEGGNADACFNLGFIYDEGLGVIQDYSLASSLYLQACANESINGCYNLAISYAIGRGIGQDLVLAHALVNLLNAQGFESAGETREMISQLMSPQQIDEAQALARICAVSSITDCLR